MNSVSFSPDGTKVASGSGSISDDDDNTVKLWDVRVGSVCRRLRGILILCDVSFSPDGTKVASGSRDNTVKLWDATSGECLQTLEGHSICEECVVFSSETKVASGSSDKTVKLWDVTRSVADSGGAFFNCVYVVFSRWDKGCVGVV